MKKTFNFGKIAYINPRRKLNLVTVEMKLIYSADGLPQFTASADVWNAHKTDIVMGGQCLDDLYEISELKNNSLFHTIYGLWKRNHLNNLNAGTVEQTELVNEWVKKNGQYDYTKVCEYLNSIGKYEVNYNGKRYKYGQDWLYREISDDDLSTIKYLLTDSDKPITA